MVVCGVKVLMLCCVEYVCCYNILVYVWLLYLDRLGIVVVGLIKDVFMEDFILIGVVYDCSEVKVIIVGLFDIFGYVVKVFRVVVDVDVNIDMVLQNVFKVEDGKIDIIFICFCDVGFVVVEKLDLFRNEIGFLQLLYDDYIGKVLLIGVGMCSYFGVIVMFCEVLVVVGVNIELIFILEIRILVLCCDIELDKVVVVLYEVFGFGGDEEVMVYVGMGWQMGLLIGIVGVIGQVGQVMCMLFDEWDFLVSVVWFFVLV